MVKGPTQKRKKATAESTDWGNAVILRRSHAPKKTIPGLETRHKMA